MTATTAAAAETSATATALAAGKRGLLGAEPQRTAGVGFCRRTIGEGGWREDGKGEEWAEGAVEATGANRKGGQQSSCHALKYVPR